MLTNPKLSAPFQIVRATDTKLPAQTRSTTVIQQFATLRAMVTDIPRGFGPALLQGLTELGPVDLASGDLTLELGISVWLRRNETSLEDARHLLLDIRRRVLEASGLDVATEPLPFIGRSLKLDVVNLVAYVGDLLRRGAAAAGCAPHLLAARVIAQLPPPEDSAIGF